MRTKRALGAGAIALSALIYAGCADSGDYGQGASPETETGSVTAVESEVTPADPGVAADTGSYGEPANQSTERQFNSLGSASAPSANVPANVATNGTEDGESVAVDDVGTAPENVQGSQTSPEPTTGDDANPDQVESEPQK